MRYMINYQPTGAGFQPTVGSVRLAESISYTFKKANKSGCFFFALARDILLRDEIWQHPDGFLGVAKNPGSQ